MTQCLLSMWEVLFSVPQEKQTNKQNKKPYLSLQVTRKRTLRGLSTSGWRGRQVATLGGHLNWAHSKSWKHLSRGVWREGGNRWGAGLWPPVRFGKPLGQHRSTSSDPYEEICKPDSYPHLETRKITLEKSRNYEWFIKWDELWKSPLNTVGVSFVAI